MTTKINSEALVGFNLLLKARKTQRIAQSQCFSTICLFCLAFLASLLPFGIQSTFVVLSFIIVSGLAGCVTITCCGAAADFYQQSGLYWSEMKREEAKFKETADSETQKEAIEFLTKHDSVNVHDIPWILGPWQEPFVTKTSNDSKKDD